MDDKFLFGVILGMLGGAFVATNSVKTRQLVKEGQTQIVEKAESLTKKQSKSGGKKS